MLLIENTIAVSLSEVQIRIVVLWQTSEKIFEINQFSSSTFPPNSVISDFFFFWNVSLLLH